MVFLRFLEASRTPAVSAFLSVVTFLGDETVFIVLAITVFWCVSKRQGYYLFAVGLGGIVVSQWLKLLFRIPRPWVLDPNFTIVESARAGAGGYSFPSGHTQSAVGVFGCIAAANRQTWLRALCMALMVLVPFSRMYLGVHTPLDVGVGAACAAALVLALWPSFRDEARFRKTALPVLLILSVSALCFAVWVSTAAFPADIDLENLRHGTKNGWSLLGCAVGLLVSYAVDRRFLRFDVSAPLLGQLAKLLLGFALLLSVRAGLKPALDALFQGSAAADHPTLYLMVTSGARYFVMVVFAGCVWPMTFPFFARLGAKKTA